MESLHTAFRRSRTNVWQTPVYLLSILSDLVRNPLVRNPCITRRKNVPALSNLAVRLLQADMKNNQ
jgi:hypothetical protein